MDIQVALTKLILANNARIDFFVQNLIFGLYVFILLIAFLRYFDYGKVGKFLYFFIHNDAFVWAIIVCMVFLSRLFVIVDYQRYNPDEDLWIASGLSYFYDPLPWRSVDGLTCGPIQFWSISLLGWVGLTINYGSVRLLAALIELGMLYFSYRAFQNFFHKAGALLSVMPFLFFILLIGLNRFGTLVVLNGEHVPMLLLLICLYLFSRLYNSSTKQETLHYYTIGFLLGCLPYSDISSSFLGLTFAGLMYAFHFFKCKLSNLKPLFFFTLGGLSFPVIVSLLLLLTGRFNDFLESYIFATFFSSEGLSMTFMKRVYRVFFLNTYLNSSFYPLNYFYALFYLAPPIGLLLLILYRHAFTRKEYFLAFFLFALSWVGVYSTAYTINLFPQYFWFSMPILAFMTAVVWGFATKLLDGFLAKGFKYVRLITVPLGLAFLLLSLISAYKHTYTYSVKKTEAALLNVQYKTAVIRTMNYLTKKHDKLAVWGGLWETTYFYGHAQLQQGVRSSSTGHLMSFKTTKENDFATKILDYKRARYIQDVKQNVPALFVDVATDATKHQLLFPALSEVIKQLYVMKAKLDDIEIYVPKNKTVPPVDIEKILIPGTKPQTHDPATYAIQYAEQNNTHTFQGWAAFNTDTPELNKPVSKIHLVLYNADFLGVFKIQSLSLKLGLAKDKLYTSQGLFKYYFKMVIPENLPAGTYQLAIYAYQNLDTGSDYLQKIPDFQIVVQ